MHQHVPLSLFASTPDAWISPLNGLIVALAFLVSAVGIGLIVWGAYCSVLRLIASEAAAARGQAPKAGAPSVRSLFTPYLLPGLDFLLAGGLIKTAASTDWQQAAVLGGLVLVRTLLSLSATWEVKALPAVEEAASRVPEQLPAPAASDEAVQTPEPSVRPHAVP
jgi:uncharacterized membrane protein